MKRLRFLVLVLYTVVLQADKLWADHYMGGQLTYETVDLDNQRGVFNVVLKLERPCNVLNKFYNEYTLKVLEYGTSPSNGYHLSVYVAKLYDSTYIYYPCSSTGSTCSNSSGQVIEVKYYKATIVIQNTDKKCLVYFDENTERSYSDNIQNPNVPLILYTEFIPKYQNSQYRFDEAKRHFPLKNKTAIFNYNSMDIDGDSVAVSYGLPYINLSYNLSGGNLNYNLTKATPSLNITDAKPLRIVESSLSLSNNQIQFTPNVAQSSWLMLQKMEYRKINNGVKDTWVCISKSNTDRLITVFDIPSQIQLQQMSSPNPNVKISPNQITICNENTNSVIQFRFPVEPTIQLSIYSLALGGQDISSQSNIIRKTGSTMDTLLLTLNYNHPNNIDYTSTLRINMDLCHPSSGVGFDKTFDIGFAVFNYKIFGNDTILSCSNTISIPLLLDKNIETNWGVYIPSNRSIYIANPKDTLVIATLQTPNANCPSRDSIYLNHGSIFSTSTVGYSPTCKGYLDASAKVVATGSNGPFSYRWSNNSTLDSIGSIGSGLHIVEVRDKDNCLQLDSVVIAETSGIEAMWVIDTAITCYKGNNGRGHIQVSSSIKPSQYFWDSVASIDSFLSNLSAGIYTGKYHYKNGANINCIQNFSFTIDDPDSMYLDIAVSHNTCFGEANGKIAIIPRGGKENYQFFFDNVYSSSGYKANLPNDTIDVYVIDTQGCSTSTQNIVISSPAKLQYDAIISNPSCSGVANGSILISHPRGGTSPYTYSFNNGSYESNNNFSALGTGNYSIVIRDVNQCTYTQNFTLYPSYNLQVNLSSLTHSACPLSRSGKIQLNITNGAIPYKVSNQQDSTLYYIRTIDLENLAKGNHIIKIKDNNGCNWTGNYTINEPDTIQLDYLLKNETCYQFADGSIQLLNITGGTQPYSTMRWYNTANDLIANTNKLYPSTYTLRFEDNQNCKYEKSFTIAAKPFFKVNLQLVEAIKCFAGQNGKLTANINGGSQPLAYRWLSHSNLFGAKLENISSGKYVLEVEDKDGCKVSDSITLVEPKPIALNYLKIKNTDCPNIDNGVINISCLSSNDTSNTLWYKIQNLTDYRSDNNFSGLKAGTYTVVAKDINQCEANYMATISVDKSMVATLPAYTFFELGETKTVEPILHYGSNTSFDDVKKFRWAPQIGLSCTDCLSPQFTVSQSNNYSVEIEYGKSCKTLATGYFEVSKPEDLFIPNSFTPNGDTKNDVWYVYGKHIKNIDIKLINRVGELIFQSNDMLKGWDGNYHNKKEQTGTYQYIIKATYADGSEKNYEGSLNLFR